MEHIGNIICQAVRPWSIVYVGRHFGLTMESVFSVSTVSAISSPVETTYFFETTYFCLRSVLIFA